MQARAIDKMNKKQERENERLAKDAVKKDAVKSKKGDEPSSMRTILGWTWVDMPAMLAAFYVAAQLKGVAKLAVFGYFGVYRRLMIPSLALLSSEIAIAMFNHSAKDHHKAFEEENIPFKLTVVAFCILSILWKAAAVIMTPKKKK